MSALTDKQSGVLLIGHGTRHAAGVREFHDLCQSVAKRIPRQIVRSSFLELVPPTVEAALDQMVTDGCQRIVFAPVLLFAAGHAKNDVPKLASASHRRWPHVQTAIADHLGLQESLLRLGIDRCRRALLSDIPLADTCMLFVGRGSNDAGASAEMHLLANTVADKLGIANRQVAFLAMASPTFQEVVSSVLASPPRCVVVVPHFLFQGELLDRLKQHVAELNQHQAGIRWQIADHLGNDPLLVDAMLARIDAAEFLEKSG